MSDAVKQAVGKRKRQSAGVVSKGALFLEEMVKLFPNAKRDVQKLKFSSGSVSYSIYLSDGTQQCIIMDPWFALIMYNAPSFTAVALWEEKVKNEDCALNFVTQIVHLVNDECWKKLMIGVMENVESFDGTASRTIHLKMKECGVNRFRAMFLRNEKDGFHLCFTPRKKEWDIAITVNKASILIGLLQQRSISSIAKMTADLELEKVKLNMLGSIL